MEDGGANQGGGVPPPSPPPRRTDPLAADRTAPDACGRPATPTARAYPGGARWGQQKGGRRPTRTPPSLGATGAALGPPGAEGTPPPPEGTAMRGGGGMRLDLLLRGSRPQGEPTPACWSNARTRTVWGPRPK